MVDNNSNGKGAELLVGAVAQFCPSCGGPRFLYNSPETRKTYRGSVVTGKYTCSKCGWQSGLNGELSPQTKP